MSTDPSTGPPPHVTATLSGAGETQTSRAAAEAAEAAEHDADPETATTHLARFEFSADGGGTKVLMVEWQPGLKGTTTTTTTTTTVTDTGSNNPIPGSAETADHGREWPTGPGHSVDGWKISWPGKSTNLPARDADQDGEQRRRVFFLLPPDAAVPTTVTITPTSSDTKRDSIVVKPLPAIFPDGFFGGADVGSRGVLHGLWAQRRVAELDREVDAEMSANCESVGVEMALAEKQWITDNFLTPSPAKGQVKSMVPAAPIQTSMGSSTAPLSPRSPTTGRLSDKLKGLKLATAPADLVPSPTAATFASFRDARGADDAVGSMSAITQSNRAREAASLDAALKGDVVREQREDEDDLFALPMSPRSPEMKKSPFSLLHGVHSK